MSAPVLSPKDMANAVPIRLARPVADAVSESEIEQLYVELPTEPWKSQVRKLDHFVSKAIRQPVDSAKTAAPYKNFWIVGSIGAGKTTLSKKKLILRFAKNPNIVVSRWIFTELGEKPSNIRMQFAEWLERLERDVRDKIRGRDKTSVEGFERGLEQEKASLFSTPMMIEGEAAIIENQFRYAEFLVSQAVSVGIETIFIIVDEYDHLIGELEQRISQTAKNMIKLLKMFNEQVVDRPLPIFLINCATSKIIEAIIQAGETAYLDRVFHLGKGVDASVLGQLDEVCLLDNSLRSRANVEAVLAHWTGRDDLLPLSNHFITGIETLTEGLFRDVAWFYNDMIAEIEKCNQFCDQSVAKRVFSPAINENVCQALVQEISPYGYSDWLVRNALDLFLVGRSSIYSAQEVQQYLGFDVSPLLDRLVIADILEKDMDADTYAIGSKRLIDVRRRPPKQPSLEGRVPDIEDRIRGKLDEVKKLPGMDRLKYARRFLERSLGRLTQEDRIETKPILGERWYSLAGDIQSGETYLVVPLRHGRLIGRLPAEFNILIYLHRESIKRPEEDGGGSTITVQDYRDAYGLLQAKDCLACLMVTCGQQGGPERHHIQEYLKGNDEGFPFVGRDDRFQTTDLEQSRLTRLVIHGQEKTKGLGRNLLEPLAYMGHYVEEDTQDGEEARRFEEENLQEVWKKIGLSELLTRASERLLLRALYKDYKTWLVRNEKDNVFAILTEARKQKLHGRTAVEIYRSLRAVNTDMFSMSERDFDQTLGRLHDFRIVNRNVRDGSITVGALMPFETYLCQVVAEGRDIYGVIGELFATPATQKEIDKADNGRVTSFVKDMMDYVRERGHVKRVSVEGKWGWAKRAWENLVKATKGEFSNAEREIREIKATKLYAFDTPAWPTTMTDFKWDATIEDYLAQAAKQLDSLLSYYERLKANNALTELEQQSLTGQLGEVKDKAEAIASRISSFKKDVAKYLKAGIGDLETFRKERLSESNRTKSPGSRMREAIQHIEEVDELAKRTGDSGQARVYLMLQGLESSLERVLIPYDAAAQKIPETLEDFRKAGELESVDYKTLARLAELLVSTSTQKQNVGTALTKAQNTIQAQDSALKDELNQLVEEAKRLSRIAYVADDSKLVKGVDRLDTERAEILAAGQLTLETFYIKRLVSICKAIIRAEGLLIQLFELNGKEIAKETRQIMHQLQSLCDRQMSDRDQEWHDKYMAKMAELPTPRLNKSDNVDVYRQYFNRVKVWHEQVQALFQELMTDIENTLSNDARQLWRAILPHRRHTEEELRDATGLSGSKFDVAKKELIQRGLARTATIILVQEM